VQTLIELGLKHATRCSPEGDKRMRLHAQTAAIENGFVWLPREAPWLAEYLRELTLFPAGRHDDQVDSTTQALAWIRSRPRAPAMAEYWRAMAEESEPGRGWGR
jgi:predicted phage terminase large subunit-like protein